MTIESQRQCTFITLVNDMRGRVESCDPLFYSNQINFVVAFLEGALYLKPEEVLLCPAPSLRAAPDLAAVPCADQCNPSVLEGFDGELTAKSLKSLK